MIRKKSGFLTFCFSLLPGAGQMYMGFMKRGISLMSSFFLLIFLSTWLNLGPLLFAMPIVWFFAFFDTHNLRSMPDIEFNAFKDDYILLPEFAREGAHIIKGKHRNIIAVALIVIGITLLWNNIYELLDSLLPDYLSYIIYKFGRIFPQLIIGVVIIAIGIILIRGKKQDLDSIDFERQIEDKGGIL